MTETEFYCILGSLIALMALVCFGLLSLCRKNRAYDDRAEDDFLDCR